MKEDEEEDEGRRWRRWRRRRRREGTMRSYWDSIPSLFVWIDQLIHARFDWLIDQT
jgi:hypothetical protein